MKKKTFLFFFYNLWNKVLIKGGNKHINNIRGIKYCSENTWPTTNKTFICDRFGGGGRKKREMLFLVSIPKMLKMTPYFTENVKFEKIKLILWRDSLRVRALKKWILNKWNIRQNSKKLFYNIQLKYTKWKKLILIKMENLALKIANYIKKRYAKHFCFIENVYCTN